MTERIRHAVQTRYLAFWTRLSTEDIYRDLGLPTGVLGYRQSPEWQQVAATLRVLEDEGVVRAWGEGEWELPLQ